MAVLTGRVLVVGANGETGRRVVQRLETRTIPTRALVRDQEKAHGFSAPDTEVVIGEVLYRETLQQAFQNITSLICTIGARTFTDHKEIETAEYLTVLNLIEGAKVADIAHFVLCSAIGTNAPERLPLAHILHAKRRAEEALIASGLTYTIIHPGGLTNNPGGQGVLVRPHPSPLNGMITRDDVAEVLVQALLQPEARNASVDIINHTGYNSASESGLFVP